MADQRSRFSGRPRRGLPEQRLELIGRELAFKIGAVLTVTDRDARSEYLDGIRRDSPDMGCASASPPMVAAATLPCQNLRHPRTFFMRKNPFGQRKRDLGLDWPAEAETMIGMQRLTSLQHCVETVLADDVPGDLVECGVWRGGAGILMRAVLSAYEDETRRVWLADSFEGVPLPDTADATPGLLANE